MTRILSALLTAATLTATSPAWAAIAKDWQMGFQEPASFSAEHIQNFHHFILWIIVAIAVFVMCLLLYVIVRFNKRANPVPQQFSHNVLIEIIWTVIPVVILIIIAVPSFQLLYYTDRTAEPEMTLKVT